jgi:hypothetical protein
MDDPIHHDIRMDTPAEPGVPLLFLKLRAEDR